MKSKGVSSPSRLPTRLQPNYFAKNQCLEPTSLALRKGLMSCKVAATWDVERAWAHHLSKSTGSLLAATETIQSQDTGQVFGFEVMLSIYK